MEQQQHKSTSGGGPIFILAVDKSKHSEYALNYYVNEVHKPGNVLHVIHCTEELPGPQPMDGGPSPGHYKELKAKDQEALDELKTKVMALLKQNQVPAEFHPIPSNSKKAWHDIVSYQEKVGGVMIIMGSRGLGALRRTMMGSVSDSVVHHAHCPVLVCRHS